LSPYLLNNFINDITELRTWKEHIPQWELE